MDLIINGENRSGLSDGVSIADAIQADGVKNLDTVAVQLNGKYLPKERFNESPKEGDEIDYVFFVGGGR